MPVLLFFTLIFDSEERSPDDDLRLQFEALKGFSDEEKQVAKTVLESLILQHNAKRAFADQLNTSS